MTAPCLVLDVKRNGCVKIAEEHPENLWINICDQDLTILSRWNSKL